MADNHQSATTVAASSAALTVPTVKKLAQHQQAYLSLSLSSGILRFDGPFTLKSGRSSPYFFNAGKFFESGDGLAQLASCYAQTIVDSGIKFDTLFGPAYKGIPLAAVTALVLSRDHGMSVGFSFNRKEAKAHGEGGNLVGAPLAGRILVLDDVITAGTAIKEAFGFITASAEKWDSEHPDAGGEGGEEASGENVVPAAQNTASLGKSTNGRPELVGVVVALDRQERTSDAKDAPSAIQHVRAEYGVEVLPVVTLEDIIEYMRSNTSSFEKEIEGMQSYREQYGVAKAKE